MKTKINIVLLICLLSISLSACATNKTDSAKSSTFSPEETNPLPTDTYKAVLQNQTGFINTDDNHEVFLNDFLSRNSKYGGTYKVPRFTVLDLDGNQIPELVLELSLDYPEQYEILYCCNGTVYGYNVVYRGFEMLKEDGTYSYANSASDVGVEKISCFKPDSIEKETLGYAQMASDGINTEISYFIHDASVNKEAFDAFLDQQNEKKDMQWYEFSAENIEAKI